MTAPWPILALITLLGLLIGSFLNVVIYRVPRRESVLFPASHCPSCSTPIKSRHNVPVLGWLVLRGRCARCAEPISVRYPLVEAATGAAFAAVTMLAGLTLLLPVGLVVSAASISLSLMAFDRARRSRSALVGR